MPGDLLLLAAEAGLWYKGDLHMHNLLNPDNKVMRLITKIADSVFLNLLWLIFSLPVITAGASTTALFDISIKMVNDEEGNLLQGFWRSFRSNLSSATRTWLILLALGAALGVDGYFFYHMRFENPFWTILTAVYLIAAAAYLIILMYVFALMACFENTSLAMIRNALMIGMRFLFCTALQAGVYFLMILIAVRFFTPILMFGEGLCALLCSYLMNPVLISLKEQAAKDQPAEDETDNETDHETDHDTDTGFPTEKEENEE